MFLAKVFDSLSEASSVEEFEHSVQEFLKLIKNTVQNNRNAYTIACGTSFHATKIGALFFNEIAGVEIIPILPGDFRVNIPIASRIMTSLLVFLNPVRPKI